MGDLVVENRGIEGRAPTGEACKGSTGGPASKVAVRIAQKTIRSSCTCVLPDTESVDGPVSGNHAAHIALRMIHTRLEHVLFLGEKGTQGAMVCLRRSCGNSCVEPATDQLLRFQMFLVAKLVVGFSIFSFSLSFPVHRWDAAAWIEISTSRTYRVFEYRSDVNVSPR